MVPGMLSRPHWVDVPESVAGFDTDRDRLPMVSLSVQVPEFVSASVTMALASATLLTASQFARVMITFAGFAAVDVDAGADVLGVSD